MGICKLEWRALEKERETECERVTEWEQESEKQSEEKITLYPVVLW